MRRLGELVCGVGGNYHGIRCGTLGNDGLLLSPLLSASRQMTQPTHAFSLRGLVSRDHDASILRGPKRLCASGSHRQHDNDSTSCRTKRTSYPDQSKTKTRQAQRSANQPTCPM